jgi:putative acetyltransferase
VLIRPEAAGDADIIRAVTAAAFSRPAEPTRPRSPAPLPAEATLVDELRAGPDWLPRLSLVAISPADGLVGHVLCTRGHVGAEPVLALGPLSVRPDRQRTGVGSALMHGPPPWPGRSRPGASCPA